jgi:hypothetical protein
MTNQNDAERFLDRPVRTHGEDSPDVEGHIRRVHSAREVADASGEAAQPGIKAEGAEGLEEGGPDVEGHIFRA